MEAKDVKYPNGSVKKVRQAAVAPSVDEVKYKECRRNHALASGGHAVDGCGEWMPLGGLNPDDASSYKCAACGCHRNFHHQVMKERSPPPPPMAASPATVLHGLPQRREETPEDRLPGVDSDTDSDRTETEYDSDGTEYDDERSVSPPLQRPPAYHPAPVVQQPPACISSAPHMLLSLNSSVPGAPQSQRLPAQLSPATAPPPHGVMPARKRFRTIFTVEQKLGMQELSERLGWCLQKRDKDIIDAACHDIGVSKDVFKVWMHNKKRKYPGGNSASAAASSAARPFRLSPATVAPPVLE